MNMFSKCFKDDLRLTILGVLVIEVLAEIWSLFRGGALADSQQRMVAYIYFNVCSTEFDGLWSVSPECTQRAQLYRLLYRSVHTA